MDNVIRVNFVEEQEYRHDLALAEMMDAELPDDEPAEPLWQCPCGSVVFHITDFVVVCAGCDVEF